MHRIMPKDSSRARTHPHSPVRVVPCETRQMRSSEACSSAKTVVAPTNSSTTPNATAAALPPRGLALSSRLLTAAAPLSPSRPTSWPWISPRAASSPKTVLATAITISSNGAIEKIV